MAEHLGRGESQAKQAVDDAEAQAIVEGNQEVAGTRGEAAARNVFRKAGGCSSPSFRTMAFEIEAAVNMAGEREIGDTPPVQA